jgi:Proline racemase
VRIRDDYYVSCPSAADRSLYQFSEETIHSPGVLLPQKDPNDYQPPKSKEFVHDIDRDRLRQDFYVQPFDRWSWKPPVNQQKMTTIDTHTGGEPMRIIISSSLSIQGRTVLEKRQYFTEQYENIRTGLLREPRGHADMYAAVVTPPEDNADLDVFFLNT